jgi:hypothetical protein
MHFCSYAEGDKGGHSGVIRGLPLVRLIAPGSMKYHFSRRSVDITLPNLRRVISEPILDLSLVARENPRNVANRHPVLLVQVNRVKPQLPGGSMFVWIFVVHVSTPR